MNRVNLKTQDWRSDKELLDSSHIYELLKIDNNLWHSLRDHENQKEQLLLQIEFDEKGQWAT